MSRNANESDHPTRTRPEPLDGSAESTFARPSTAPSLSPGATFGPYRIIRLLGKGGMGEAYEAEQTETGRRLALKVLADPDPSPQARERFLREGRLAASINHLNSVYVFGTEEIEGRWAIAMELVGGGTLKDRVREKGPLPPREVADTILQVIDGLEAAASAGILHRDIKPANCFLELDGTAKIGDFGLSLSTLALDRSRHQLTGSGTFLGTPAFASPEQLRGADIDVRSDIYSLGATMYYLLVGRPPFENANLMELLTTIASVKPAAPHRLRREIPRRFSRLVLECLATPAESRPRDYARLREELRAFGTPVASIHREGLSALSAAIDAGIVALVVRAATAWSTLGETARLAGAFGFVFLPIVFRGRSLGDQVMGLRVADRSGAPLSDLRAVLAGLGAVWAAGGAMSPLAASLPPGPLLFMVVFAAVVRTGFIDRMLGLRRISAARVARRSQPVNPPSEPRNGATLGPYRLQSGVGEAGFEVGYDALLLRPVWIQRSPADRPLSAERRDLRRETRLRWINGGRTESGWWDAYEAPVGECLARRLEPMDWQQAHRVVLQLAKEILAGRADRTLPPSLSLDKVWVGESSEIKLLDGASPRGESDERLYKSDDDRECLRFLGRAQERLVAEHAGPMLLPRNARCFLAEVEGGSLRSIQEALPILTVLARGEIQTPLSALAGSLTLLLFFGALLPFVQGVVSVGVGDTELTPPTRGPKFPAWLTPWDLGAIGVLSGSLLYMSLVVATWGRYSTVREARLWPARVLSSGRGHEILGRDGLPAARWRAVLRDVLVMAPVFVLGFATLRSSSGAWMTPLAAGGLGLLWASWRGGDPLGRLTQTHLVPTHLPFGDGASDRSATYEVLRETLERAEFKDFDGRDEGSWRRMEAAADQRPLFGIKWPWSSPTGAGRAGQPGSR
jgi:hypothetical protein